MRRPTEAYLQVFELLRYFACECQDVFVEVLEKGHPELVVPRVCNHVGIVLAGAPPS